MCVGVFVVSALMKHVYLLLQFNYCFDIPWMVKQYPPEFRYESTCTTLTTSWNINRDMFYALKANNTKSWIIIFVVVVVVNYRWQDYPLSKVMLFRSQDTHTHTHTHTHLPTATHPTSDRPGCGLIDSPGLIKTPLKKWRSERARRGGAEPREKEGSKGGKREWKWVVGCVCVCVC